MVHAGADVDQPIRSFDQRRQNVGGEYVDREDAGNSGLGLDPSRLVTDTRIVDYSVEVTKPIDLSRYGRRTRDGWRSRRR